MKSKRRRLRNPCGRPTHALAVIQLPLVRTIITELMVAFVEFEPLISISILAGKSWATCCL
jgi:hypothetical protein